MSLLEEQRSKKKLEKVVHSTSRPFVVCSRFLQMQVGAFFLLQEISCCCYGGPLGRPRGSPTAAQSFKFGWPLVPQCKAYLRHPYTSLYIGNWVPKDNHARPATLKEFPTPRTPLVGAWGTHGRHRGSAPNGIRVSPNGSPYWIQ